MSFKVDGLLFEKLSHYDLIDSVDRLVDELLELGENEEILRDEYLMKFVCCYELIKKKLESLDKRIVVYERKRGDFFDVFYCISDLFLYLDDVEDENYPFVRELTELFNSKVEVVYEELSDFSEYETESESD